MVGPPSAGLGYRPWQTEFGVAVRTKAPVPAHLEELPCKSAYFATTRRRWPR